MKLRPTHLFDARLRRLPGGALARGIALTLLLALSGCGEIADQLVERARVQDATGQAVAAERSLSIALTLAPEHIPARVTRASQRLIAGDARGAAEDLTRVIELAPQHSPAWLSLAVALRRAGEIERALEVLAGAAERWPGDVAPRMLGASIALEAGDLGRARERGTSVLDIDPLHPEAHQLLGDVAVREARWEDALRHYFTATDRPDATAPALERLAGLLLAGERPELAAGVLERIVEQHPAEAARARESLENLRKQGDSAPSPPPGETKPGNR